MVVAYNASSRSKLSNVIELNRDRLHNLLLLKSASVLFPIDIAVDGRLFLSLYLRFTWRLVLHINVTVL